MLAPDANAAAKWLLAADLLIFGNFVTGGAFTKAPLPCKSDSDPVYAFVGFNQRNRYTDFHLEPNASRRNELE